MRATASARFLAGVFLFLCAAVSHAGSVTGRLLDAEGRAVAGAKVSWFPYRTDEEILLDRTAGREATPLGETSSDVSGYFRVAFDGPSGGVSLRVTLPERPILELLVPFDPPEQVELDAIQIPRGRPIRGRVVDESGHPVANALVEAQAGLESEVVGSLARAEAQTGSRGEFEMAAAPSGFLVLGARVKGFASSTDGWEETKSTGTLTLRRGGTVRGRVLDPGGAPASGAVVVAREAALRTDDEGRFHLADVPLGTSHVMARWKDDFVARAGVTVQREKTEQIVLRLWRAPAISGLILSAASRRPIRGARIFAWPQISGSDIDRPFHTRSDERGRFRLAGLQDHRYSLSVSKEGYLAEERGGVRPSAKGEGVSVALSPAATLIGRVMDEARRPVAGARVHALRHEGFRSRMFASALAEMGVFSGVDGRFRLRALAPRQTVSIEAIKPGWVPARLHGIRLEPGVAERAIELMLRRGHTAKGSVVDPKGDPVAGASLRVEPASGGGRHSFGSGGEGRPADAKTRPDGRFEVSGLEPGGYEAEVSAPGYLAKRVPTLEVRADQPTEWPPIVLEHGVAISGIVRTRQGDSVASAAVRAFADHHLGETATSAEGRFRLEGLPAGMSVLLGVWADGFAPAMQPLTPPAEEVEIVLPKMGVLRGRVENAESGRALEGASVSAEPGSATGFELSAPIPQTSGSDGAFELAVAPSVWTVLVNAPGYLPARLSGLEVAEGDVRQGIVVSLRPGGTLTGRVLDSRTRAGVPNATMAWSTTVPGIAMGSGPPGSPFAEATDVEGRFRLEGLPAEAIMITAHHPDYVETTRQLAAGEAGPVEVLLGRGSGLSGTVVAASTRAPLAGAEILLEEIEPAGGASGRESTVTDSSGAFRFDSVKPGRLRLSAQHAEGKSRALEIPISEGELASVLLEVDGGAVVRGKVVGLPEGRSGEVRIYASGKEHSWETQSDDAGDFVLRGVPAGTLKIHATSAGFGRRSVARSVEIPESGEEIPVEIAFDGASRVSGRVRSGESAAAGLLVTAYPEEPFSDRNFATGQTDAEGRFVLELPDGSYMLNLRGNGIYYRRLFTVSSDTVLEVVVPTAVLRGRVTEAYSGRPVESALIEVRPSSGDRIFGIRETFTDSLGAFLLSNLDSGSYEIKVSKGGFAAVTHTATVGAEAAGYDVLLVPEATLPR